MDQAGAKHENKARQFNDPTGSVLDFAAWQPRIICDIKLVFLGYFDLIRPYWMCQVIFISGRWNSISKVGQFEEKLCSGGVNAA